MGKYVPKFDKDNNELLILDTIFNAEGCLEFANAHNMNVLFTDTTSTSSIKVMMDFQESGYNYKLYKERCYAPDGIELEPKVLCLFERKDNLELKDIIRYIAVNCTVEVEDATDEEFNHVDDFMSDDTEKIEKYKNAKVSSVLPFSNDCIQINVYINEQ